MAAAVKARGRWDLYDLRRLSVLLAVVAFGASTLHAKDLPPPAYQLAARAAGIPSPVLYAVALQESGTLMQGRLIPWPWTLNVAGAAQRYATRAEACTGLHRALRQASSRRIDVGLGQINLGYQASRYATPCELLDPYRNLAAAAAILREQRKPGEDWMLAIGRYHRPAGGEPAAQYRRRVGLHLVRVLGLDANRSSAGVSK